MGQVKGASAHLVTHLLAPNEFFKWQGAYAAFSVSPRAVDNVYRYIAYQREHHTKGSLVADWENWEERAGGPLPAMLQLPSRLYVYLIAW